MNDKPLNPTEEYYGEVARLLRWINERFFEGALDLPMITFRMPMKFFGRYIPARWDHNSGSRRAEFKLNPLAFRDASFEQKCLELLRLMVLLHQNKDGRSNYHDAKFAKAMWLHGVQTHRVGAPDKETGEHVEFSVIPGMKFEKELAKKSAGLEFTWAIHEDEKDPAGPEGTEADPAEPRSSSGKRVKYVCAVEACKTSVLGRSGQSLACMEHGQPAPLTVSA
ncbi:MAG: hypothetical protein IT557_17420 [Alphaproteobacteria bacterium]|nr:hypothetical protein [Alphaproteobacteria bacterium]